MPLIGTFSAPTMIGRERELAAVGSLLASTGGTLLVSGEAGIGKSRLMREAVRLAAASGILVLHGSCFDRDQTIPFAPVLDLLRGYAATGPEARNLLAATVSSSPKLLPELSLDHLAPEGDFDVERDGRRLVHEVTALLATLANRQPLLLIVEDLHWSDEASPDLLLHLIRHASTIPVRLVLTFRGDESHRDLSRLLDEIDRGRSATEIALGPLSPSEVELQVRDALSLPRPAGQAFVRSLHGHTGGNPFYVEEILRTLAIEGDIFPSGDGWQRKPLDQIRVPRSVEDVVRHRAAMLTPDAGELLTLAAVAGQRVDFPLLLTLSGLDDGALIAAIKELIAAQFLAEAAEDQFTFRHALTRQAVYAGLLTRERRALHARVAEAISGAANVAANTSLEELAYHAFEAGNWERAATLCRTAADRAWARGAPHAAATHSSRALEARFRLGLEPDAALLLSRGQAYDAIGDFSAARADYEAALTAAETEKRPGTALAALLGLGLLWSARDYARALTWLNRASAMARTLDEPAALAHALNRIGNWRLNNDDVEEGLRCHYEALAIFEELDDRRGMAETFDLLAMAHQLGGDILAGQASARKAAALFEEQGDRQGLAGVLLLTTVPGAVFEVATMVGESSIASAASVGQQALALARKVDWRAGEAFLLALIGEAWAAGGEFGTARAMLQQSIAIAEELDHRQWLVQARWGLARLFGVQLQPEQERDELERVLAIAMEIQSPNWIRSVAGSLASTRVTLGELPAAEALLARQLTPETPMRTQGQRLLWAARAELALAHGSASDALGIVDPLFAATINLNAEHDVPYLARIKATALATLGDVTAADALLRAAMATAETQGALPMLRSLHVTLAGVLRWAGHHAEADAQDAAARTIAQRLASTISEATWRDQFRRAAGLDASATTDRSGNEPASGRLTPREREVALKIAAGLANREIAADLFISERTIEAHVANILRKLAVPSRAGIAAWVEREGISRTAT
jgi:DNA-binding CsgD family transcriptional regulator/tetratricopeptide (TPR) repeat protein